MRKYLALTKVLLKTGLNMAQGGSANRRKTRKRSGSYLIYLLLLICLLPLLAVLYSFGGALYTFIPF